MVSELGIWGFMKAAPIRFKCIAFLLPLDLVFSVLGSLALLYLVRDNPPVVIASMRLALVTSHSIKIILWLFAVLILLRRENARSIGRAPFLVAIIFAVCWGLLPGAVFLSSDAQLSGQTIVFSSLATCLAAFSLVYPLMEWLLTEVSERLALEALAKGEFLLENSLPLRTRLTLMGFALAMAPIFWMSSVMEISDAGSFVFMFTASLWAPLTAWFFAAAAMVRLRRIGEKVSPIIAQGNLSGREKLPQIRRDEIGRLAADLNEMISRLYESDTRIRKALESRDDFISVASHELRTPLTALQLNLEILVSDAEVVVSDKARFHERKAAMFRQIRRLKNLMESLLDLTAIRSGGYSLDLKTVDFKKIVSTVIDEYRFEAKRNGQEIQLEVAGPLTGTWDPVKLEQLVTNLLSNALKYGDSKPVTIKLVGDQKQVTFTVTDRGIGIPEAKIETIFERFGRAVTPRHYSGFGLGLYIAHHVVAAHGGQITVQSEEGKGTTFKVTLPRAPGTCDMDEGKCHS